MTDPEDRRPEESTRRLRKQDAAPPAPEEPDYSATRLDWGGPPAPTPWLEVTPPYSSSTGLTPPDTVREPVPEAAHPATTVRRRPPATAPTARFATGDHVLHFGPGVPPNTGTVSAVWHGLLTPEPPPRRRPAWRGYLLAGFVLLCSLAYAVWQWLGTGLDVKGVTVTTAPAGPACDGTADIVATVRTNGRGGSVTYRWERSDGTGSGVLTEHFGRGQEEARIHLLWKFRGEGTVAARAELVVTSPGRTAAATEFTYSCP
ncbi:hypothetical protein SRB5_05840 [Streptomyces sp. RB5]|uniref:Uncharacterized protein n=1 Tax=Streptomyces smaragdinus TaxID=2585196 RepID=A0A7K0CAQ0_9ACTN|nr:hypothetical protein [Streptomyces smaragdinus]MQY10476.1 hypothetical protein [Streptomyces smaragdinus]